MEEVRSANGQKIVTMWSKSCLKAGRKYSQSCLLVVSRLYQSCPEVVLIEDVPNLSQRFFKVANVVSKSV